MIFRLNEEIAVPDPRLGDPDGLLAVGGDLSTERLLLAYHYGIFPWYSFRESKEIEWWCPMRRFVIFPKEIHISHSMRTLLNKEEYTCTFGRDFEAVVRNCSQLRIAEEGAWLGDDMIRAYTELHKQGFAESVEVRKDGALVGGLYGVLVGRAFVGESMFSLVPNASKVALIFLARLLERNGGTLIDCQLETPHLRSMGGRFIPYDEYLELIGTSLLENDEE
ncbi:MAG: leucyl/phenylalanyl-tRNA--protein transferase [Paludibacteraceae bacterium]|nr:leucyl/phenylalanyl-tRNA--protein transferase [Paludibacteraceae bacterium]